MASNYPTGLDAFTTGTLTGVVSGSDHGNKGDALNKIEAELGTNPSGASATVGARVGLVETGEFLLAGAQDPTADIHGFRYKDTVEKTYTKGLFFGDTTDTPDLAGRRKETTPLADDQPVWNFYGQTWISGDGGGGWDPGSGSQSRSVNIQHRTRGTQSSTNRGGAIGFHTCPVADIYARDAMLIESDGEVIVGTRSGGGKGITFEVGGPRIYRVGAAARLAVQGGSLRIEAADTLSRPALELRQSNDTTYGYDFDVESASTGELRLYTVVGGTRSRALTITRADGGLEHHGTKLGFYDTTPIAKQTGVAVTAGGVHAALVNLGLIAA